MRIDCPRKEFLDAVQLAGQPATSRSSTIPLLQSVLVEAQEGRIRLVGCDGEMWVERTLPTMVADQGALALDARLLNEILGSLPDGDVHLEQPNGTSVRLSLGQSDYRVVGVSPEDFPVVPGIRAEAQLSIKASEFQGMIDSVDYAVARENQGRAVLTGVLFAYEGETLRTVATDTHRLAVRSIHCPGIGSEVTAIVPARALAVIKKLPVSEDGDLSLSFGEGRLVVEADGAKVVTQLLDGQFPPYERVIPTEHSRRWLLDRETFAACLKRCSILAKDNSQRVVMGSDGNQVTLTSRSEGRGEGREEMEVVKEGDDIEVAFNGRYLLDALNAIDSPGVALEMTEPDRAAVLKPGEDDSGYLCVVMPMAL